MAAHTTFSPHASTDSKAQTGVEAARDRYTRFRDSVGRNLFSEGLPDARQAEKQARQFLAVTQDWVRAEGGTPKP